MIVVIEFNWYVSICPLFDIKSYLTKLSTFSHENSNKFQNIIKNIFENDKECIYASAHLLKHLIDV